MSYKVLALKYRPQTFTAVAGQHSTLLALQNSLANKQLHHAYLFTGTRGVGKTSLARILAKCLICEQGISATPCGVCDMCVSIANGNNVDVLEIDAASRTKVEDTRDLLDNVPYAPVKARFKIYIIDEVHMLSNHSFNALLKTLEEPPEHVKFILATTDPQKLPKTILSRCLQFHLRALDKQQIINQLVEILTLENIQFERDALAIIAKFANGSMRDSLSLLEQVIAFSKQISVKDVAKLLGTEIEAQTKELLVNIIRNDANATITLVRELATMNADFNYVLKTLQTYIYQLALLQVVPQAENDLDPDLLALQDQASAVDLQIFYQTASMGVRDLPYAPDIVTGFEMIVLRMLAFQPVHILSESPQQELDTNTNDIAAEIKQTSIVTQKPHIENISTDDWAQLCIKLKLSGITKLLAENCTLNNWDDDKMELILHESQKPLLNPKNVEKIQNALRESLQKPIKLTINIGELPQETPASQVVRQKQSQMDQAILAIKADQNIRQLEETFGAKIADVKINET